MRPLSHPSHRASLVVVAFVALLALPGPKAAAQDSTVTVSLDGIQVPHPCTGQLVTLEGEMRVTAKVETTADGDPFTRVHMQFHAVTAKATAALLGEAPAKYVYNEVTNDTSHVRLDQGPITYQSTQRLNFIRCSETGTFVCCGDDWHLQMTVHITQHDGGKITAMVSNFSAECR